MMAGTVEHLKIDMRECIGTVCIHAVVCVCMCASLRPCVRVCVSTLSCRELQRFDQPIEQYLDRKLDN